MAAKPSTKALTLIFLIFLSNLNFNEAAGFSVDLIHRDAFLSDSPANSSDRFLHVRNALRRSHGRVRSKASADVLPDKGAYVMKFSVGTPPLETAAIADTGSDLTWIQCKPCRLCFPQNIPLFDPKRSSSYKTVPCNSDTCRIADLQTACNGRTCTYSVQYGDRSFSRGDLGTDTIKLGDTSVPNIVVGCGHFDQGSFGSGTAGIVGLGGGKTSLITQLGKKIEHKFSYCLVPLFSEGSKKSSKLNFGQNAVVSGAGVITTPIIPKSPETFYYLDLKGMTVGNQRLDLVPSNGSKEGEDSGAGNIIIDSGTTLTYIPTEFYGQVRQSVKRQMKLKEIMDPAGQLDLCFELREGEEAAVPAMAAHFRGADVELKAVNTFVQTSERSLCLAFAEASGLAIYGNIAQGNFLVGYDLQKKTVSFKPTDCAAGGK
ncbi:aspartic proteinase CDR1-like [Andrographis paniculata]|uniref:aspartic proteinase CDR1-like n=1 Tax=Andrographis paniculata TaxID=175694 RepID=UPI0021E76227|nr:aspartic proteinase CDR1-like [Andrographis paniculata]